MTKEVVEMKITVDRERWEVTIDGKRTKRLTIKEFELLEILLEYAGKVVSQNLLMSRISRKKNGKEITVGSLRVYISRLRGKIREAAIVTVRGVGIILDCEK